MKRFFYLQKELLERAERHQQVPADFSKAGGVDWAFIVASAYAWAGILLGLNFPQAPKEGSKLSPYSMQIRTRKEEGEA